MADLPAELRTQIFIRLNLSNLLNVARTCIIWYEHITDKNFLQKWFDNLKIDGLIWQKYFPEGISDNFIFNIKTYYKYVRYEYRFFVLCQSYQISFDITIKNLEEHLTVDNVLTHFGQAFDNIETSVINFYNWICDYIYLYLNHIKNDFERKIIGECITRHIWYIVPNLSKPQVENFILKNYKLIYWNYPVPREIGNEFFMKHIIIIFHAGLDKLIYRIEFTVEDLEILRQNYPALFTEEVDKYYTGNWPKY